MQLIREIDNFEEKKSYFPLLIANLVRTAIGILVIIIPVLSIFVNS